MSHREECERCGASWDSASTEAIEGHECPDQRDARELRVRVDELEARVDELEQLIRDALPKKAAWRGR